MAEEELVLAWYDEAGNKWVELDCVVDTSNNTITASIEHFATFAIIGMVASAPESEPEVSVAVFRISELDISPSEVDIGQTVTISVLVINSGNLEDTYQVTLETEPASTLTPPATHTPPPAKPINWPVVCGIVAAVAVMGSLLFFLASSLSVRRICQEY